MRHANDPDAPNRAWVLPTAIVCALIIGSALGYIFILWMDNA